MEPQEPQEPGAVSSVNDRCTLERDLRKSRSLGQQKQACQLWLAEGNLGEPLPAHRFRGRGHPLVAGNEIAHPGVDIFTPTSA
jgi:hypothetical protein